MTMLLLFLPRLLGIASSLPKAKRFGGFFRLLISASVETVVSILTAPVLMLFHTFFVFQVLLGWQIKWTTQNRADKGLSIFHCLKLYGWQSGLGFVGQMLAWSYLGLNSYWLTPIFVAWMLAPLTAWVTSWRSLGGSFRVWGLLIVPEESQSPEELDDLAVNDDEKQARPAAPLWPQALLSPYVQAVHLSMARQRSSTRSDAKLAPSLAKLCDRLIQQGPTALKQKEILQLLCDAKTVFWLHGELWSCPDRRLHSSWKILQSDSGKNSLLRHYMIAE